MSNCHHRTEICWVTKQLRWGPAVNFTTISFNVHLHVFSFNVHPHVFSSLEGWLQACKLMLLVLTRISRSSLDHGGFISIIFGIGVLFWLHIGILHIAIFPFALWKDWITFIIIIVQGRGDTSGGCKCMIDGRTKCHKNCNYCHWPNTDQQVAMTKDDAHPPAKCEEERGKEASLRRRRRGRQPLRWRSSGSSCCV